MTVFTKLLKWLGKVKYLGSGG